MVPMVSKNRASKKEAGASQLDAFECKYRRKHDRAAGRYDTMGGVRYPERGPWPQKKNSNNRKNTNANANDES